MRPFSQLNENEKYAYRKLKKCEEDEKSIQKYVLGHYYLFLCMYVFG